MIRIRWEEFEEHSFPFSVVRPTPALSHCQYRHGLSGYDPFALPEKAERAPDAHRSAGRISMTVRSTDAASPTHWLRKGIPEATIAAAYSRRNHAKRRAKP